MWKTSSHFRSFFIQMLALLYIPDMSRVHDAAGQCDRNARAQGRFQRVIPTSIRTESIPSAYNPLPDEIATTIEPSGPPVPGETIAPLRIAPAAPISGAESRSKFAR